MGFCFQVVSAGWMTFDKGANFCYRFDLFSLKLSCLVKFEILSSTFFFDSSWTLLKSSFLVCIVIRKYVFFFFHFFLEVCWDFSCILLKLLVLHFIVFFKAHKRKEVYLIISVYFKCQCCWQREISFCCAGTCGNSINVLEVEITLFKCCIHVSSTFMRATDVCCQVFSMQFGCSVCRGMVCSLQF